MNCDILIRKADKNDVDDIKNITKEAFSEYASKTTAQRIDALFETHMDIENDIENKIVFAAVCGGKVLGSLRLEISENTAYLTRFAVQKADRSRGIGGRLIDYASDFVHKSGVGTLCLHTDLNMKQLVGFYKRHGFEVEAVEETRGYMRALLIKEFE